MFYEDGRVTEINFTIPHDKEGGTSEASDGRLNPPPYGSPSLIREDTQITLINGYFPNGGTRTDGTEMLTYKLKFYDCLIDYIQYKQASGRKVIVVGDYNICHTSIDIARPKENETSIGFLPVERDKVSQYLSSNDMVDVFRHFHPDKTDEYTWWSYRA
jgi:exodeoxyribonuclease III